MDDTGCAGTARRLGATDRGGPQLGSRLHHREADTRRRRSQRDCGGRSGVAQSPHVGHGRTPAGCRRYDRHQRHRSVPTDSGAVGQGPGVEFLSWLIEADLPDPEAVLADPESFVIPARGDRAYAALSSIAAAVAAEPTPERWEAGWIVFGNASGQAPDVAAAAAQTLARSRPKGAPIPPQVTAFAPLLRDAGLLD